MVAVTGEDTLSLERPQVAKSLVMAYYLILFSVFLLVGIGLAMVISSHSVAAIASGVSPWSKAIEQIEFIAVGVVFAFVASRVSRKIWQSVAWIAFAATATLQGVVVLGAGLTAGGNTNWLAIGDRVFQPSEFLKYGLAVWLGSVLAVKARRLDQWKQLAMPALIGVGLAGGLVAAGHDAGTASIIGLMALGALVIAGVSWPKLAVVAGFLVVAGLTQVLTDPGRMDRVRAVFAPDSCAQFSECWQVEQASYALAEGGWLGQGLGESRVKWGWLSQADSDFIFAIIGAELGLVGCLVVLLLFGLLAVGLFQVVRLHPDRTCQITAGAIGCWLLGQAIVNIGMVIRVLPVIGVPLPFVSAGGSALIASLAAIGTVIGFMRTDPDVGPSLRARRGLVRRAFGVFSAGGGSR
jgi:cell division protein FtsW